MSHFPDLLIGTYHELREVADYLRAAHHSLKSSGYRTRHPGIGTRVEESILASAERLGQQAAAIKKRMKSLGYYGCWRDV
jgi:hypothetical protein